MKRGTIGKAIVLMLVGGGLLTVSIVSDPERSSAISPAPQEAVRWLDESGQWPLVGEMISLNRVIRVYAADGGTMYTVLRPDGTLIRSSLSGDEVAELFPDLDLSPTGDQGYLLMQIETDG